MPSVNHSGRESSLCWNLTRPATHSAYEALSVSESLRALEAAVCRAAERIGAVRWVPEG